MAKKKTRKQKSMVVQNNMRHGAALGVPQATATAFMKLYSIKKLPQAQQAAQLMTDRYPESAFAWKALGTVFLEAGDTSSALVPLLKSYELNSEDALTLTSLAAVYYRQGNEKQAISYQTKAVNLQPEYGPAQYRLAEMLQSAGDHLKALEHAQCALKLDYDELNSRSLVGALQYQTKYFSEALKNYHLLESKFPGQTMVFNNLGNLYKDLGEYEKAERYYQKALYKNPGFAMAYSNIFFAKHYNPATTKTEIIDFAMRWEKRFALPIMPSIDVKKIKTKPLRVGLISSGFRTHPVGQMIATALECSRSDIQFYAYSTNDINDLITQKIRNACKQWHQIRHLSQEATAELIRHDQIDILIDLSGHGDGSCLQAISMRPAPLCVKWVGGLVNTMGLKSIDYLLSDSIETPEGIDGQYTEKLIRLPDDYICYMPCSYAPSTTPLPALKNRYITLGCLNNPAKISSELLSEWAVLMNQLADSRLLLRGPQYENQDFCRRIWDEMAEHGINQEHVLLEGPAKHQEFLKTYQRIDIALDTWPYSGGLTTCEAMLMGVPVVTLPGPTFAGRHSATHLINAGLPELVANSWDEYRQRVIELANDLPNLALIRAGLRIILHNSPVCDAPRFANHFNNALRAIWVRYCEDKTPEALTFNKAGKMWFADEEKPVELPEVLSQEVGEYQAFEWKFDEPIIIIDNAAILPRHPDYPKWMASGHLAVISFDPASLLSKKVEEIKEFGELHHYPHALLGDGQPATLYATLDAEKSSTLTPLAEDQLQEYQREKLKVLAELPINTVTLDNIEGLSNVDMLVLDDLHDAMKVLESGERTLKNTLLIQVKVAFQPTHERQTTLAELQHWVCCNGFRFYRMHNIQNYSHLPENLNAVSPCATEQESADVLFLPSRERMAELSDKNKAKLAYILSAVFAAHDIAFKLLANISHEKGLEFLEAQSLLPKPPVKNCSSASTIEELVKDVEKASLSQIKANHSLPGHLVVSLTSYKARFDTLHLTLRSLLLQKVCPDLLILWIAENEKNDLPKKVLELEQYGLEICFCENIRSYKKIIPTLKEYPDSFIATADDDVYYEPNWLKSLLKSWDNDNKTIVAHRAHKIRLDKKGNPLPYRQWKWEVEAEESADGFIFPTGCGGVLYPPHVFNLDVTNKARFLKLCPNADDIWLYWMASLNGAKAMRSNYKFQMIEWPRRDASSLWQKNIQGGGNDQSIKTVLDEYGYPWENKIKKLSKISREIKVLACTNDTQSLVKISDCVGTLIRIWPFETLPTNEIKNINIMPKIMLGDGRPSNYYVFENPAYNSMLQPFSEDKINFLQKNTVNTVTLNEFSSFSKFDWLYVDNLCDLENILSHADQALREVSIIQVKVFLGKTHKRQYSIIDIVKNFTTLGFRLITMHGMVKPKYENYRLRFSENARSLDLIFMPTAKYMSAEKQEKIKYILNELIEFQGS